MLHNLTTPHPTETLQSSFEIHVKCADQDELSSMAAAFAALPCKVLWRLTRKEVPDEAALAALKLGNNTQVSLGPSPSP